jgi:hypothetical protein
MKHFLPVLVVWMIAASTTLSAQAKPVSSNPWVFITEQDVQLKSKKQQIAQQYATARMDVMTMKKLLKEAPLWFTPEAESKTVELWLPMPDGTFEQFRIQYAPVMAPELAKKYPMIRSYAGIGIDDPTAYLRFDMTPKGFHASIFSAHRGTILIDPYSLEDIENYVVYDKKDYLQKQDWECFTTIEPDEKNMPDEGNVLSSKSSDCIFRSYSLALACTSEFAECNGDGTKEEVMATFDIIMTRVNGIFENEAAITMVMAPNTDKLIFINPEEDPFPAVPQERELEKYVREDIMKMNQRVCDDNLGFENYDIGHVFATTHGGQAEIGSVCSRKKARGVSGYFCYNIEAVNDYRLEIQVVAHEIGHQFGAKHTFSSCGENTITNSSVEPGSGSTIMSYAGTITTCYQEEYVKESPSEYADPYFHAKSLEEIHKYIQKAKYDCYDPLGINNNPPVVDAGIDYKIPILTPFVLKGSEMEDRADITYCWEQMDAWTRIDRLRLLSTNKTGALFRSFLPTTSPERYFPTMHAILNNDNVAKWEVLPSVNRTLNFRLTVRDNSHRYGCTGFDDMIVEVVGNSGPFVVTQPNTNVNWPACSQQIVNWDVANTDRGKVECKKVDILLSVDGGMTFSILVPETDNDGSETVIIPNNETAIARIMVRASDNIFFDVSNTNFVISPPLPSNIEWQNTIGGSSSDRLYSIQQTSDGGYILGGTSSSGISGDKTEDSQGGNDYWVVKLDASGQILWQNTIGGSYHDGLNSIQQTSDGGYILGGTSSSGISGDKTEESHTNNEYGDYWVVKLDASGVILWQNTIGGNWGGSLYSVQQTSDGGYILGGDSQSDASGDKTEESQGGSDYWVVKLDASGQILWQNTIGGSGGDHLYSVQQTSDEGYILGGYSSSNASGDKTENSQGDYDYWVVKLDASGVVLWQNTIGGSGEDDILHSIQQTSEDGYILGGYSDSSISGDKTESSRGTYDYWVVKLNDSGNILWQNTIGGNSRDRLYSIQQTRDGGYILGGDSRSDASDDKTENSQGVYDYWVVKLSPDNCYFPRNLGATTQEAPLSSNQNQNIENIESGELRVFPNPTTGTLELQTNLIINQVRIIDILGRTVEVETGDVREINMTFLPSDLYFLEVRFEGNKQREIVRVIKN